jgi:hypothetical protein
MTKDKQKIVIEVIHDIPFHFQTLHFMSKDGLQGLVSGFEEKSFHFFSP